MAITKQKGKQIRKTFRSNYGPKPKYTTADVKTRRNAVKAGQSTYAKKDGTTGQLTREQKLRTMKKMNKAAAKKRVPVRSPSKGFTQPAFKGPENLNTKMPTKPRKKPNQVVLRKNKR